MDKYQNFFDCIEQYIAIRNQQISNGINDYNMVNVVRKENAEVGMHSNVIYSLIDPYGLHYRGDLFLQLFIKYVLADEEIKIDDFGEIISVKAEEATTEATAKNRRIDFTIKSTKYYVGIEMKIDAADSSQQIYDYEKDLLSKANEDRKQKVIVYYLTKDAKEASKTSITKKDSSEEITYKQRSFEEHILNWIKSCQNEVENIPNLNNLYHAFENYKDIVKKITGKHRSKLVQLEDYLEVKFPDKIEIHNNIFIEIDAAIRKYRQNFYSKLSNRLKEIKDPVEIEFNAKYYLNITINDKYILHFSNSQEDFDLYCNIENKNDSNYVTRLHGVLKAQELVALGLVKRGNLYIIGRILFTNEKNLFILIEKMIDKIIKLD